MEKHIVGVYFHAVPFDPQMEICSLDHKVAQDRGYFKVDLLNVKAYGLDKVRDEEHLDTLVNTEPMWEILEDEDLVNRLFHLNGHFNIVKEMNPTNVLELAMTLAIIRPAKRYLLGKSWEEVKKEIWIKPEGDSYYFKKSHSIGYATAIVVQMNLMIEGLENGTSENIG